ncbi:DUF3276 family protein [Desulfonema magnum]|uniref:DUF3276 n=1 Tax=Desulfonema magnum TaxID=45655 RepID=A0A975BKF7_9BACT|nr:DUF3276 family protein [Desulfonema magnum]QTA87080.1 DUF3276 [Desulfonema magnum]
MTEAHVVIILTELILLISILWLCKKNLREKNTQIKETPEKDYADYLQSKHWEGLRKKALERADYKCELCKGSYAAVHHIRYPKKYQGDHLDNLLVVCEKCHAKLHGIRDETAFQNSESQHTAKKIPLKASEKLFSEEVVKGSGCAYFFDVEYSPAGEKQLVITEDRPSKQNTFGDYRISVTEANLNTFARQIRTTFEMMTTQNELYSEKLLTSDRTYFFDVKIAVNGRKYVAIAESKRIAPGSFERSSITVFENVMHPFASGLENAFKFLNISSF